MPTEAIAQCNLRDVSVNDEFCLEVQKGMPELKQSGIIAHDRLPKHLEQVGYECSQHAPSLWHHEPLPISFTLVVEDFGAKHVGKDAAMHLTGTLRKQHVISID